MVSQTFEVRAEERMVVKTSRRKTDIPTIKEKNRIIDNIIDTIARADGFLLTGHNNPDEDCIASMVAFGLLLSKLAKNVHTFVCNEVHENFQYLLKICEYNSINVIRHCDGIPENITTLVILDTPKPDMLMGKDLTRSLLTDPRVRKIEIDHHLEADSAYGGDPGYCFVDEASSTCELIGYLALKLEKREALLEQYHVGKIMSRNFVLAVLTGMIGDSKMGKYLKSNREKWFYHMFSSLYDDLLSQGTFKGSSNFSNMNEVFSEMVKLTDTEQQCYQYMIKRKRRTEYIGYVVLDKEESEYLADNFDMETIISIARTVADRCAEETGYVSLVAYYDSPEISSLIQFRMRRSQQFRDLDLRKILSALAIENGGGHPGAVGYRIDKKEVADYKNFVDHILSETEKLITGVLR